MELSHPSPSSAVNEKMHMKYYSEYNKQVDYFLKDYFFFFKDFGVDPGNK